MWAKRDFKMTGKTFKLWLAMTVAGATATGALAATTAAAGDVISSRTLTGAILSAQVAEGDNDFKAMIAYYKQALAFDPGNKQFEQSLLVALITDGHFADALPYAEKLKSSAEIERVSRVSLAIDAIGNGQWDKAETLLKLALQSDLDRLITGLMTGWVKLGDLRLSVETSSESEEFEADTDGAILAWRAGYEAWGLVAVMQRFEAASRNRYAADTGLTGHPEPLQRFKILDEALRSRNEKDTLGELGAERFQAATQSVRQRRS